jgi:hypothetical protein
MLPSIHAVSIPFNLSGFPQYLVLMPAVPNIGTRHAANEDSGCPPLDLNGHAQYWVLIPSAPNIEPQYLTNEDSGCPPLDLNGHAQH